MRRPDSDTATRAPPKTDSSASVKAQSVGIPRESGAERGEYKGSQVESSQFDKN